MFKHAEFIRGVSRFTYLKGILSKTFDACKTYFKRIKYEINQNSFRRRRR